MEDAEFIDHDLVAVEEFDAVNIELKTPANSKFPAKEHARKVARELGVDNGLIYIPGKNEEAWEDSDMSVPFRQRRYFYYLSGANFAQCAVTYDIGADNLILWIPYTPPHTILWTGTTPSPADCLAKADLDNVKYIAELPKYLVPNLALVESLYVLGDSLLPNFKSFETLRPHIRVETASLRPAMDEARVVKTAYELAMIRRACDVSSAAHRAVCRQLRGLTNECEIEAVYLAACIARNAHAQAYAPIVGSGPNAACLHYDANNEPLAGRQVVVVDAGAEWDVYASDITRTLPLGRGGRFTPEARDIYALVDRMQTAVIERIRPGAQFYALQVLAHQVAAEGLLALGILHGGTARDVLAAGTSAAFFPHGLGHHIGLEVHDVPGYERLYSEMYDDAAAAALSGKRRPVLPGMLRTMLSMAEADGEAGLADAASDKSAPKNRRLLAKDMVITVEPGIYFCREYIEAYFLTKPEHAKYINMDVLDQYWGVGGVRIEDDILVTDDGWETLSWAPKGEEALRIIAGEV